MYLCVLLACLQVQQASLGTELLSVQKTWQAQQQQMEQVRKAAACGCTAGLKAC
jgi:hypothetical protein